MKRTVITELDSAIELSKIALESDNKEKIARLRESARKAYGTLYGDDHSYSRRGTGNTEEAWCP
jgi:hypothetical protein